MLSSFFLAFFIYVALTNCQWKVPSDVPSIILGYFGLISNASLAKYGILYSYDTELK